MNDIVNFFVITVIFPILFLCGSSFAIGLFVLGYLVILILQKWKD